MMVMNGIHTFFYQLILLYNKGYIRKSQDRWCERYWSSKLLRDNDEILYMDTLASDKVKTSLNIMPGSRNFDKGCASKVSFSR